jgi:carboxymethylenebutenolidase
MSGDVIRIPAADSRGVGAYLAVPEAGSGPGILLLYEGGIVDDARQTADLYAAEGYVVLCPQAPRTDDDAAAAIAALQGRGECTGKIAVLGFGRGGLPALRAAADKRAEGAVCYYPGDIGVGSELASRSRCSVMMHFAEDDPAVSADAVARINRAFAGRPEVAVYVYPGTGREFGLKGGANYDRAAADLAHSRSIALLRRVIGPHYDLEALWEAHTSYEFETRDVEATMATMVADPYVNHVPVMTGGVGQRDLARFYANHFIPKCPADTKLVPISRTIGADCIVDEMLFCFTHDTEIDFMLPGVPPTGRYVEVPTVAIVKFRGDKLYHEHIYWDQASVLVQIGLLDPKGLPVAGVETAKKLLDETLPSNTLMKRWPESAPKVGQAAK